MVSSMKNYVITIARGFGSGGKEIGNMLSEKLGIPCYEKQIPAMASEQSGLNESLFNHVDEKLRKHSIKTLLKNYPDTNKIVEPSAKKFVSDNNLFNIQAQIIRELARTESCIVIGKCADVILKNEDHVISIYVEAPRRACVASIMDKMCVDEAEANSLIYNTDKYRAKYYTYYSGGKKWTNPTNYDMTLNSDRVGRANCVEMVCAYLKLKGFIE